MAEIAGAVVGLLTCLFKPNCLNTACVARCKFVINPTKHIKELGKRKETLIAHKEHILEEVDGEEGRMRSKVVKDWLEGVNQFLGETNDIEEEANKTRRGLVRLLPNCCSRSRMGESIPRLLKEATEFIQSAKGFSREYLSLNDGRRGTEFKVGTLIGETTAYKTMEIVWGCLMNKEIAAIGVYGMGGVGKTTIVMKINNRALLEGKHVFEKVIWVTVSKNTSIREIQVNIARALNLSLPEVEDQRVISASLFGALKQRKNVLFILDDMWEEVSLDEIGIPEPTEENGCKILLTTRRLEVCRKMGCHENSTIRVDLLSKEEARKLFMENVDVELSPEVTKIAESVVEECARLPLAIITVGGAMRGNTDISEWRLALKNLKGNKDISEGNKDMETKVYNCLKFSYDQLPDEKFKKCFLYCALYPEDWKIDPVELKHYWVMGGLIKGGDSQDEIEGGDSQDEIDQCQSVLNKLKHHCLLESVQEWEYDEVRRRSVLVERVKLHDLIRDMALRFTSLLPSIVRAGVFLKELPNEPGWSEDLESASFMKNEIEEISISPRCPKLSILLLHFNMLHSIPSGFFVHMQGLRVLNLSENHNIRFLPDSISDLVNLHALHLSGCSNLKSLPSLSKLQLLRVLDLRGNSNLESFPDSISDLTKLLTLRLSYCSSVKRVPSVAKLVSLRTLELDDTAVDALPQGMEMLVNLTRLDLYRSQISSIPQGLMSALSSLQVLDLSFLELETLSQLGSWRGFVDELLTMKALKSLSICFPSLSDCANFVGSPRYKSLEEFCIVIGDPELFYKAMEDRSFIVHDPVNVPYSASFLPQNTEQFDIQGFNDMRSLNDLKCLKEVNALRFVTIARCEKLEYVIKHEEEEEEACTLLWCMEELEIQSCGQLHSIYHGVPSTICRLRTLAISYCHKLESVFSSPKLLRQFQNLEVIKIRNCHQLKEIIKAAATAEEEAEGSSIYRLRKLEIYNCDNLENVFSSSKLLRQFQNLEEIRIEDCYQLKEITKLTTAEEEAEATNIITLPKLKSMYMWRLPNLKNIWRGEMVCDSLQHIQVHYCHGIKRLPTLRGEEQLPPPLLSEIIIHSIRWWDSLEWDSPFAKTLFQPFVRDMEAAARQRKLRQRKLRDNGS